MFEMIKSIRARDPAQPTFWEVVLGYNGFHAVILHRLNNAIWHMNLKAIARFLANISRILTGIEIHPEAKIGKNLFIDHGTGVVIGQTAIVKNNVTIYHGVTLGGIGIVGAVNGRRHPLVFDDVMIGAGAQILGNVTIGEGAKIGANSVVTNDVPPHSVALGIPARIVSSDEHAQAYGMPGREEMEKLSSTLESLLLEVEELKKSLKKSS